MSKQTAALAATPNPLGRPGGPGLFHDKALHLPPYVQNVARSLMTKRGMDRSRAIATALATMHRWAAGRGNVRPEVRAAAAKALAQWDTARAAARATPNRRADLANSIPNPTDRSTMSYPSEALELANPRAFGPPKRFRHGWIPIDADGNDIDPAAAPPAWMAAAKKRKRGRVKKAVRALLDPGAANRANSRAFGPHGASQPPRAADPGNRSTHPGASAYRPRQGQRNDFSNTDAATLDFSLATQPGEQDKAPAPQGKPKDKKGKKDSKHQLPPGATGWKHGWVPVDSSGKPVGPSQMNKSAQEIKDGLGHDSATKDAIHAAYQRKAKADGEKAARKAKAAAKRAKAKREADARHAKAKREAAARHAAVVAKQKARAAEAAKRRAKAAKDAAARKKAADAKRAAAAKASKEKQQAAVHERAKAKAAADRRSLMADALRQAQADKKAGRELTPSQEVLLLRAGEAQAKREKELRNVSLSQEIELAMSPVFGGSSVPSVSSSDGVRGIVVAGGRLGAAVVRSRRKRKRIKVAAQAAKTAKEGTR